MSKKPETQAFTGFAVAVPSSQRQMNFSNEVQDKVRTSYKDQYGGSSSSNVTTSYKAQEFVDRRTGQLGFKQEAKVTSTERFVDNQQGVTIEYQTQLKQTKSVYPNNNRINYY